MLSLLLPGQLFSFDVWDLKRRKQQTEDELGYFFYPLVYTVPGIGSGNGAGGTILNLLGDGSTLNLIQIQLQICSWEPLRYLPKLNTNITKFPTFAGLASRHDIMLVTGRGRVISG